MLFNQNGLNMLIKLDELDKFSQAKKMLSKFKVQVYNSILEK